MHPYSAHADGAAFSQLPAHLLKQMRTKLSRWERDLVRDNGGCNEDMCESIRRKAALLAECAQCSRAIHEARFPKVACGGALLLSPELSITRGQLVALPPLYWNELYRAEHSDLLETLKEHDAWAANRLVRKFVRQSAWDVLQVRVALTKIAKQFGEDAIELPRWEKDYCRVPNLREKFVPFVCGDDDEARFNRIFDNEPISLDLALVARIDATGRQVELLRVLRVEQCDIPMSAVEQYAYAEREVFVDTTRRFTLSFENAAAYVRQVGYLHAFNDDDNEQPSTIDGGLLDWLLSGPNRFFTRTPLAALASDSGVDFVPTNSTHAPAGVASALLNDEVLQMCAVASAAPEEERLVAEEPLRVLDLFAGCGGLSVGLEQAGIMESSQSYAVEFDPVIARIYARNHAPKDSFIDGVGEFLYRVEAKARQSLACLPRHFPDRSNMTLERVKSVPLRGEVDMVVGGPPCQGFSGLNVYKSGETSAQKRNHVVSFLSAVDLLRPRYAVMENVRGLTTQEPDGVTPMSMVVDALLAMGMQVRVHVLQAAAYGVPQTRTRVFVIGAAPGEVLPAAPLPTHSVHVDHCEMMSIGTGGRKFIVPSPSYVDERPLVEHHTHGDYQCTSGVKWTNFTLCDDTALGATPALHTAAMYPAANIWAAIGDLADAKVELNYRRVYTDAVDERLEIPVADVPVRSFFQAQMRRHANTISAHWSKQTSDLDAARIAHVPRDDTLPDADWRLVPNLDGTHIVDDPDKPGKREVVVQKLDYRFAALEFGARLLNRGVCPCNDPRSTTIDRRDRALCSQYYTLQATLIPYSCAHTAESKNQWAGLMGRPYKRRPFQTIVTNVSLTAKQGQVLHYCYNRTFTCRELARGQAFPDWMRIDEGTYADMTRMIGNAVPPPLSRAVGAQIVSALNKRTPRDDHLDDQPLC